MFSNGAKTFEALRGREGELANLIRSSNELFKTTATRDQDIEALFRAFPTFQDESRLTVDRLKNFAVNADPLSKQLVPVAEELSPTLVAFGKLAPEAKKLFEALPAVEKEAPTGFPALRKLFRDDFPPLLRASEPFVRNLNPVVTGLDLYKQDVAATFGNLAAAFHGHLIAGETGTAAHYLRVMGPINAESLSTFPNRLTSNRNSPYSQPGWAGQLLHGSLPVYDNRQCTGRDRHHRPDAEKQRPCSNASRPNASNTTRACPTKKKSSHCPIATAEMRSRSPAQLAEEVRLRRSVGHGGLADPGLQPAGAVQIDLRQRRKDAVPAHLRTDRALGAVRS